jgi:hypothetical protein
VLVCNLFSLSLAYQNINLVKASESYVNVKIKVFTVTILLFVVLHHSLIYIIIYKAQYSYTAKQNETGYKTNIYTES